jgi:hypothetical protein
MQACEEGGRHFFVLRAPVDRRADLRRRFERAGDIARDVESAESLGAATALAAWRAHAFL